MSHIPASLLHLMHTGCFGPIAPGMTNVEVERLLGRPRCWGGQAYWWTEEQQRKDAGSHFLGLPYHEYPLWWYDEMEFHFGKEGRLYLIWCDHLDQLGRQKRVFKLDRWIFRRDREVLKQELLESLRYHRIPYEDKPGPGFGEIFVPGGGYVTYELTAREEIVGIGCYDKQYV